MQALPSLRWVAELHMRGSDAPCGRHAHVFTPFAHARKRGLGSSRTLPQRGAGARNRVFGNQWLGYKRHQREDRRNQKLKGTARQIKLRSAKITSLFELMSSTGVEQAIGCTTRGCAPFAVIHVASEVVSLLFHKLTFVHSHSGRLPSLVTPTGTE